MNNLILWKQGEDPIVSWIKKRIKLNLNFLSITTGSPGNGKSWFDLSIAEMIDPEFNPEKQIAFSPLQFMNALNGFNGADEELAKKKHKVLLYEEFQKSSNRRKWQSKINELINLIVSTFRNQHIIVLFNTPYTSFIDSNTVKLLCARIETKGWSKKDGKSGARFKILQYNDELSKMYTHSLHIIKGGEVLKMNGLWIVNKPSKRLTEVYERRKNEFTTKVNLEATADFEKLEGITKEEDGYVDMDRPHQEIYITYHTITPIQRLIGEYLGKSQQDVAKVMKTMDKYYRGWRKDANLLRKDGKTTLQPTIAQPQFN
jgi:hypothetical protein